MQFPRVIPLFIYSLLLTNSAYALQPKDTEQLKMPHCLAAQLSQYPVLAANARFKILDVPSEDLDTIARIADKVHCGRFINLSQQTTAPSLQTLAKKAPSLADTPYTISHPTEVFENLAKINGSNIINTVTEMTHFFNRAATRQTGLDTAVWLRSAFKTMARNANRLDTATWLVPTGGRYLQPSVVTVIGKEIKAEAIVIGAHMDTLAGKFAMPGADDDASGSACIMEMARVLLESKQPLKHPIYFIWYAAEEQGLLGSQQVVKDFEKRNIAVKAVVQFDMTGFRADPLDTRLWLYTDPDYTNRALTNFMKTLIEQYVGVGVGESACGYACSDHVSWAQNGIPAVLPTEADFTKYNRAIHTPNDTLEKLNREHMLNFTKLGLAFAIELAF